ncbi:MAG: metal-sensitive transcriptional regulator [Motilibacteraceae bacterium]
METHPPTPLPQPRSEGCARDREHDTEPDSQPDSQPNTRPAPEPEGVHPDAPVRGDLVARLHRVEGQIGGVVRMLEARRDCADVVTQLAAASHALDRVGFLLVAAELRSCVSAAAERPEDAALAARTAAVEKLFLSLA